MSDLPIKCTLKAGAGFDAPWLTVDAATPEDLEFKLQALANGSALAAVVEAANTLKAANNAAPLLQNGAEAQAPAPVAAAPAQPQGWGAPAAAAPAFAQPAQQAGPVLHPTDVCPVDNQRVQEKVITSKKNGKTYEMWVCPNQRTRGDGHYSEFKN